MESNDDPEVIRAKYFIRDEFLVGYITSTFLLPLALTYGISFLYSVYLPLAETENTTAIHISHAPLTQKTLNVCLMIAETLFKGCTFVNMNCYRLSPSP